MPNSNINKSSEIIAVFFYTLCGPRDYNNRRWCCPWWWESRAGCLHAKWTSTSLDKIHSWHAPLSPWSIWLVFPETILSKFDFFPGLPALMLYLCLKFITDLINPQQHPQPSCQNQELSGSWEYRPKPSSQVAEPGDSADDREQLQGQALRACGMIEPTGNCLDTLG